MFAAGVDPDFRDKLVQPIGNVEYMLVPRPEGLGSLDAINSAYPGLYEGTAPFVSLEQDWGEWRLFHVDRD
jgi:hypothetical protein